MSSFDWSWLIDMLSMSEYEMRNYIDDTDLSFDSNHIDESILGLTDEGIDQKHSLFDILNDDLILDVPSELQDDLDITNDVSGESYSDHHFASTLAHSDCLAQHKVTIDKNGWIYQDGEKIGEVRSHGNVIEDVYGHRTGYYHTDGHVFDRQDHCIGRVIVCGKSAEIYDNHDKHIGHITSPNPTALAAKAATVLLNIYQSNGL